MYKPLFQYSTIDFQKELYSTSKISITIREGKSNHLEHDDNKKVVSSRPHVRTLFQYSTIEIQKKLYSTCKSSIKIKRKSKVKSLKAR